VHDQRCHALNWPKERRVGAGKLVPVARMCQNTAKQEKDCVGSASGIATTPGSDVTSCSMRIQAQDISFWLCTSSNTPSILKGYYNRFSCHYRKE
jgi:hypothetical protein